MTVVPALLLSSLMLGAIGLALSAHIRQMENFAGVMNFVIFPMFFLSTALYPLWKMAEASLLLRDLCAFNPLTSSVELIRFALYGKANISALSIVCAVTLIFGIIAVRGYDPARSARRKP